MTSPRVEYEFSEITAHIVILAPRWPGVSVVARCPMRLRPRLRPLDRLNPASFHKKVYILNNKSMDIRLHQCKHE